MIWFCTKYLVVENMFVLISQDLEAHKLIFFAEYPSTPSFVCAWRQHKPHMQASHGEFNEFITFGNFDGNHYRKFGLMYIALRDPFRLFIISNVPISQRENRTKSPSGNQSDEAYDHDP